jgi:spectinomycin phosphotransferase
VPPPEIARDYDLRVSDLRRHEGGFDSDCWVADGAWFVKRWRRPGPPDGLALLADLAAAGLPVPVAVPTRDGASHAMADGRANAVFPFVPGRGATDHDWLQTAESLRQVHEVAGIDLPVIAFDEPTIEAMSRRLDHPWVRGRRGELVAALDRLAEVTARARVAPYRPLVCHRDFGGLNLLVQGGRVSAILDWEQAVLGPREHDVWIAAEGTHGVDFLTAYGARDLDAAQLEFALLARGLRDLAARVLGEVDRPGVETWGFRRIAKVDADLAMFRPICA